MWKLAAICTFTFCKLVHPLDIFSLWKKYHTFFVHDAGMVVVKFFYYFLTIFFSHLVCLLTARIEIVWWLANRFLNTVLIIIILWTVDVTSWLLVAWLYPWWHEGASHYLWCCPQNHQPEHIVLTPRPLENQISSNWIEGRGLFMAQAEF